MINFVRKKMLLFLLLIISVTMPMEQHLFHLVPQLNFCEALTNTTMPMEKQLVHNVTQHDINLFAFENTVNLGMLTAQAALLIWLKKKHCLFSTELIPKKINDPCSSSTLSSKHVLAAFAFSGLFLTALCAAFEIAPQVCAASDFINNGIHTLLLSSSMIHLSNLVYDDALKVLKKGLKKFPIELAIKNKIDIIALNDAKCLICYDDQSNNEYVNPCEQNDHIFCKNCLMRCLDIQKDKSNFVNKYSFLCEMCRKEVSFDDKKFEVTLPPKPKVTLGLWAYQQMGIMTIYHCIGLIALIKILQCQFFS